MKDAQPAVGPTPALRFAEVLRLTLTAFTSQFGAILFLVLIVAIPVEFIKNYYFVGDAEESFFRISRRDGLVSTVFLSLITPSLIHYVYRRYSGTGDSLLASLAIGLKKWPRIILYGFIKQIIIVAGLIFFVVPGIIFYFRLIFVDTIITIEGTRGIDPIGKSRVLSQGSLWDIVRNMCGMAAVAAVPLALIWLVIYWLLSGWIAEMAFDLSIDLAAALFSIQALVMYLGLRDKDTKSN